MNRVPVSRLYELFRCEGGRLFWIHFNKYHPDTYGAEAGSARESNGRSPRWQVKIGGKAYKRAHIVYAMTHGRWAEQQIDHINGDSLDDRPANLREVTAAQNAMNHKRRAKRAALPMGVRRLGSRFQARIGYLGSQIHLGCYASPEEAARVYQSKRKELFGEYAPR